MTYHTGTSSVFTPLILHKRNFNFHTFRRKISVDHMIPRNELVVYGMNSFSYTNLSTKLVNFRIYFQHCTVRFIIISFCDKSRLSTPLQQFTIWKYTLYMERPHTHTLKFIVTHLYHTR